MIRYIGAVIFGAWFDGQTHTLSNLLTALGLW